MKIKKQITQYKIKKKYNKTVHLGYSIGIIVAIFIYRSPRWFLPSLKLTGLSGEEAKNRFLRLRPSWILDQNDFSYLTY